MKSIDYSQKIKLSKGPSNQFTKDQFLFMLKSLGSRKRNTKIKNDISLTRSKSPNQNLQKSYSSTLTEDSSNFFKKIEENRKAKRNSFKDCLDTTSTTTTISSLTCAMQNQNNAPLSNDTSKFVFKKKICHYSSKSQYVIDMPAYNANKAKVQNDIEINLEELIIVIEKLNAIKMNIQKKQLNIIKKVCFDWWNFYFNCSIGGNIENFFIDFCIRKCISSVNLYILLCVLITYEIACNNQLFINSHNVLSNVILLQYNCMLDICEYLMSKIKKEYLSTYWVEQFKQLIEKNKNQINHFDKGVNFIEKLNFYTNCSGEYLKILTINIQKPNIGAIFANIRNYTTKEINFFFLNEILRITNINASLPFCNLSNTSNLQHSKGEREINIKEEERIILKNPPIKNLTLILDLDETLMCFNLDDDNPNQGFSRLRPFLYDFLDAVGKFYELIVFTAATQDYADPILDAMESKKKYFTLRLYRESCIIIDGDYVKDISQLGRDIQKVIIVDNMQQNYKLQKENGILISSFWGDDVHDRALKELKCILIEIAYEFNHSNKNMDVRDLLKKYKEDIIRKVSCKK